MEISIQKHENYLLNSESNENKPSRLGSNSKAQTTSFNGKTGVLEDLSNGEYKKERASVVKENVIAAEKKDVLMKSSGNSTLSSEVHEFGPSRAVTSKEETSNFKQKLITLPFNKLEKLPNTGYQNIEIPKINLLNNKKVILKKYVPVEKDHCGTTEKRVNAMKSSENVITLETKIERQICMNNSKEKTSSVANRMLNDVKNLPQKKIVRVL